MKRTSLPLDFGLRHVTYCGQGPEVARSNNMPGNNQRWTLFKSSASLFACPGLIQSGSSWWEREVWLASLLPSHAVSPNPPPTELPRSFGCKNSYFTDIDLVVVFPDCENVFSGCALLEFCRTHFYGIPPLAGPWQSFPAWHLHTLSHCAGPAAYSQLSFGSVIQTISSSLKPLRFL